MLELLGFVLDLLPDFVIETLFDSAVLGVSGALELDCE
jgi:hypothetical protein